MLLVEQYPRVMVPIPGLDIATLNLSTDNSFVKIKEEWTNAIQEVKIAFEVIFYKKFKF